jgi:DNA-binding XRE family transcriptional regulator
VRFRTIPDTCERNLIEAVWNEIPLTCAFHEDRKPVVYWVIYDAVYHTWSEGSTGTGMAKDDIRRFGEKVRALRTRRGLTTRALADALESTNSYISKVETGKVQPGIGFAYRIATYFGVTTDALLDDARDVSD